MLYLCTAITLSRFPAGIVPRQRLALVTRFQSINPLLLLQWPKKLRAAGPIPMTANDKFYDRLWPTPAIRLTPDYSSRTGYGKLSCWLAPGPTTIKFVGENALVNEFDSSK